MTFATYKHDIFRFLFIKPFKTHILPHLLPFPIFLWKVFVANEMTFVFVGILCILHIFFKLLSRELVWITHFFNKRHTFSAKHFKLRTFQDFYEKLLKNLSFGRIFAITHFLSVFDIRYKNFICYVLREDDEDTIYDYDGDL